MTYDQAIAHFKTGRAIADALGVSPGRVSQCKTAGGFSFQQQCVLEKASEGQLLANQADVPAQTA
ncbi:hypothetical protein [Pseudomonas sp. UBA6310]|uniref:hypothetical protein n=1 Tax=Pseudomonas sp. UBA6310 TaxID=1947327 RepID=UPI00257E51D7|nr:hypothetical protein [Pseudomonas sp. UBA6310]